MPASLAPDQRLRRDVRRLDADPHGPRRRRSTTPRPNARRLVDERRSRQPRQHPLREPAGGRGGRAAVHACSAPAPPGAPGRCSSSRSMALSLLLVARAAPWPAALPRLPRVAIVLVALAGFGTGLLFLEGQWDGVSVLGLGCRVRPLAARPTRRSRLRARIHGGDRQTAAGDRDRRVHDRPARLARRRRGARRGGGDRRRSGSSAPGRTRWRRSSARSPRRATHRPRRCREPAGCSARCSVTRPGVFLLAVAAGIAAAAVAGWLGTVAHRRPDLFEPSLCGAVALSLFASPHLLGHDLTLLAPVLVAGLAWLAGRPGERGWPGLGHARRARPCWVLLSFASLGDLSQNTRRASRESDALGAAAHRRRLVRPRRRRRPRRGRPAASASALGRRAGHASQLNRRS